MHLNVSNILSVFMWRTTFILYILFIHLFIKSIRVLWLGLIVLGSCVDILLSSPEVGHNVLSSLKPKGHQAATWQRQSLPPHPYASQKEFPGLSTSAGHAPLNVPPQWWGSSCLFLGSKELTLLIHPLCLASQHGHDPRNYSPPPTPQPTQK